MSAFEDRDAAVRWLIENKWVMGRLTISVEAEDDVAAEALMLAYGGGGELGLLSEAVQAGSEVLFTALGPGPAPSFGADAQRPDGGEGGEDQCEK